MKIPSSVRHAATPVLAAVFPVLSLYSSNTQYPLSEVGPCVLWAALGGLGGYLLLLALYRDSSKASVLALPGVALFFIYGAVRASFVAQPGQEADQMRELARGGLELLYALLWGGFGVGLLAARRSRPLETLARVATLVVACVFAMPVLALMPSAARRFATAPAASPSPPALAAPAVDGPDIYYIVLDSYARQDILEALYGVDNREFLDALRARGFFVADRSRANYLQTHLSLASSLNYRYLDDVLVRQDGEHVQTRCYRLVQNSDVGRFLKARGYSYVSIGSGWWFTSPNRDADVEVRDTSLDVQEFRNTVVKMTPLVSWPRDHGAVHRQRILFGLNALPEVAPAEGPKFVFMHTVCPHSPFVFDRNGDPLSLGVVAPIFDGLESPLTREQYTVGYREQLLFLNTKLIATVDAILARYPPDRRPIIILQGDHGSGLRVNWRFAELTYLPDRASILMAVLLPADRRFEVNEAMTPVNLFPIVFNGLFDARLPLLPDKTYFVSWDAPATYTELPEKALDLAASPPRRR